jgi:hypothetical protein
VITACIAVGSSINGGVTSAIAERGNSGTWSLQTVPTPEGATASELNGVECTSSTSCIAVGDYTERGGAYFAMSATWNGTSWTLQTVPNPAGTSRSILLDVSCTDASNCTGAGAYRDSRGVQHTLAERWNGTSWSIQTTPNPAESTNTVLQNISCAERFSCVAVGDYVTGGTWVPMAQYWNGITWSLDTTVNRARSTFSVLNGVACRIMCVAVGWGTEAGRDMTIGEARAIASWTLKTAPDPTSEDLLNGIGCYGSNACFAVGSAARVGEAYIGGTGTWLVWESVAPAGSASSSLADAACAREPTTCTTVGSYKARAESAELPYAATWTGERWTIQTVPLPEGARSGALNDVSCAVPTACKAVGSFVNASRVEQTLVVNWNGSRWSVDTSPNVAGASTNKLMGVSCFSSRECTAVGMSFGGTEGPVIERWNGTTWALQTNPTLPPGVSFAELLAVSCAGASACTAVGQDAPGGGDFEPYAASWDGTRWTSSSAPYLVFTDYAYLDDVSCTSATACVAVGTYQLSGGGSSTLAAEWDGTSWTVHSTPSPGTIGNALQGVACFSATRCLAAGWTSSGSYQNLAASYP